MSGLVAVPRFSPGSNLPDHVINLALGYPDVQLFPHGELIEASARTWARPAAVLGYGPPKGNERLIEALRATVLADDVGDGDVLVTNGAMDALDLILRSLSKPGDVLLTEDPTFPGLIPLAGQLGLKLLAIPTDEQGIDPEALASMLSALDTTATKPVGLYVMPTFANPTGSVMPVDRRAAVVALADRHDLLVIEDDPYRDIAFDGPVPTTLHAAAPHRVVHIRSLSKVLAPGLRLAATVGPRDLIDLVAERKPVGGTNPHTSEAIAELLGTFDYPAHVARLRAAYRHRRDVLVGALASLVPVLEASPPAGGFFTWVPVPGHLDPEALHLGAVAADVHYLPHTVFTVQPGYRPHLRLCFSLEPPERMVDGIARLADVIDRLQRG